MRAAARWLACCALLLAALVRGAHAAPAEPVLAHFPQPGLTAEQLGVIVNDDDPDSVAIAAYYMAKRGIPAANLIHVRFRPGRAALGRAEFDAIKRAVDAATPDTVEAYALTWAQPYRVDCMSITSAFALGFDPDYCADGCKPTRPSPYFDSRATRPYATHGVRPTMSLAAASVDAARALIDRGVAADGSNPAGTAYLVRTQDRSRSVRAAAYAETKHRLHAIHPVAIVDTEALAGRRDVMFYFTGRTHVAELASNTFLPGALGDHLTSAGGHLFGGSQMSSLAWLEAGATGSYGTVVEPCAFPAKFPVPAIVMAHYLQGETLVEAYWKSVQMPGQGLFIGEPLARPFAGVVTRATADGELRIGARLLAPGLYAVEAASSPVGPYRPVARVPVQWGMRELALRGLAPAYYRFERVAPAARR